MKKLFELFVASVLIFFALIGITIFYFLFIKECTFYPIDDIPNAIQGEYEIVGLTQACMMTRPHREYYLKHKDDKSDGFKRRNLIVEDNVDHAVNVKWISNDVIEVTAFSEDSVRKISKSVKRKEIRLKKNYK